MRIRIKKGKKRIKIPDIEKCEGLKKLTGLMFKSQNSKARLFEFKKSKQAIHSLFCPEFLSVWLDKNNKVLEHKLIYKAKLNIKPGQKFSKLIEIPINNKYKDVISSILD